MHKSGDVVLGKFPTKDGRVLNHYSVVLMANEEGAVLAYTTSMKEDVRQTNPATHFTSEDMKLANWSKACLWNANKVAVVPNSAIQPHGRITKVTFAKIMQAYVRAQQTRTLETVLLTPAGDVVCA